MFKRAFLFLATNLLVIVTISFMINLLGLRPFLTTYGIDYAQLALFCAIWGMSGALISLLLSKFIAKMAMGVVIINPKHATRDEIYLLEMISSLAKRAGLKKTPQVGIYRSPELNAFATGPSESHALIAVSSGLLANMNREDLNAVLGHEISHIANGDMITMTLLQGVINSFSLFFSRIIAYGLSIALSREDESNGHLSYLTYSILTFVFDIIFTLLGSLLVASYSRWREYRADAGGAKLAGREQMISALQRLQSGSKIEDHRAPSLAAFKINQHSTWLELLATHPPIIKRILRLERIR